MHVVERILSLVHLLRDPWEIKRNEGILFRRQPNLLHQPSPPFSFLSIIPKEPHRLVEESFPVPGVRDADGSEKAREDEGGEAFGDEEEMGETTRRRWVESEGRWIGSWEEVEDDLLEDFEGDPECN